MDSLYLAKRHKGEHKGRKHRGGGMKCRRRRPDDDEKNWRRIVGERMVFPVERNKEGHRNGMFRGEVMWRGRNDAEVPINGGERMINIGNCMKPQLSYDKEVINGGGGTTVLTAATTLNNNKIEEINGGGGMTVRKQQQQRQHNNNKSEGITEVEEWL